MRSRADFDPDTGRWTVGELAQNDPVELAISVKIEIGADGTGIANTARVVSLDQVDSNTGNNSDDVSIDVLGTDLEVTKSVVPDKPEVGDTVDYTIQVKEQWPSA